MSNQTASQLTSLIERARKVLHYEQRGNHQDRIVRGGLELFAVHWAEEASAFCKAAGLDLKPVYRFTEYLESYRKQDPMQRAASLRAALSILNELDSNGHHEKADDPERPRGSSSYTEKEKPSYSRGDREGRPGNDNAPTRPAQSESNNPIRLEAGMTANHASLTLLSADVTAV
ncbi:MAG TPA: hypothetical protein VKR83_10195, partial [Ktedonobacteraceae bacterium]|nr:hypothetical protein [Ktedonobacteraceae bacterium]